MALRALIAVQLAALVALGLVTVWRFPVFALVDEARALRLRPDRRRGRAPARPADRAGLAARRRRSTRGPTPAPPRTDPATRGLAGRSYEAFQPPLYYLVAAAPFAAGRRPARGLRALRLLGVACLLLARAGCSGGSRADRPAVFAVALCFLLWPGVVVRTVTVSNAALELPLALGALLAAARARTSAATAGCWCSRGCSSGSACSRGSRSSCSCRCSRSSRCRTCARRRRGAAALALALPALLLAPWVASNVDRYGAPTASALVREMQAPVLNPSGRDLGAGDLRALHGRLLGGVLAEEWWSEFLSPAKRRAARRVPGSSPSPSRSASCSRAARRPGRCSARRSRSASR